MFNVLGASVLTETMKTAVTEGFSTLSDTVTDVLSISVPAVVAVIALTAGVGYAIRKIRSVIANAQ